MTPELFDAEDFRQKLNSTDQPIALFKETLRHTADMLHQRFADGGDITELVHLRAQIVDQLLIEVWQFKITHTKNAALIAVGGYGRGELHPASDIDLLILLAEEEDEALSIELGELITFFWDIGLEIGHSVRTIKECTEEAQLDITVATNLMEARLLFGPESLFDSMRISTSQDNIWPSDRFFSAKTEEQHARYQKYEETISNLEPNIKESPGGLRDIQMVGWVAKRHFGAQTMHDLVANGFLTEEEYQDLISSQEFLWKVRYALHVLTNRREDRVLFDYQRTLASQFGHEDDDTELGVEKFMQLYYKTALRISRMNEMLLQLFHEVILLECHLDEPKPINKRFQSRSGFLEVTHNNVFARYPLAMLELFLIMEQHPELRGVRASTIRLIRSHRHLIDKTFRADIGAKSLFMEILREPIGITHELRRMNRYGILSRYIPAFGNIVGRMQYDLFHVFTVDIHTLYVIRNLRRFTISKHRSEFPLCSDIMSRLPKPELIYLAALFHDIAKGRKGDHSTLGATDARDFCKAHGLSEYDSNLVSWLVEKHLLMSITAQRKDTSDPDVIREFAIMVESPVRLDYLYLLTQADVRATDPKKWNSWKNSLFRDLYNATRQALIRGLQNPQERDEVIQNNQAGARHLLKSDGYDPEAVDQYWMTLSVDYFLIHTWEEIAWQTKLVLSVKEDDLPLVNLRKSPTRGGNEVLLYSKDHEDLFVLTTSLLDQLRLNIVSARIETASTGYSINSFLVLDENGELINTIDRREEIVQTLSEGLINPEAVSHAISRRLNRQLKHFSTPTRIDFVQDYGNQRTIMKLVADDRPGLLSLVGRAFVECGINLINAKISTIGAEAEDTFFITDRDNRQLTEREQFNALESSIIRHLSDN